MRFSSLIYKNIRFNIKNYLAYLIGTTFIITILFMFFNLTNSKSFMEASNVNLIKDNLYLIITFMICFSIVFITYTTVSFTRYRGKELGVYYTIGLTSKDIMRIFIYENIVVSLISLLCGSFLGSLFSRIFNLAILKVLALKNIEIGLNFKAYELLCLLVAINFMFNSIYQFVFIRRNTIIDILKSNSKVKINKLSYILGYLSIIGILGSMILYNKCLKTGIDIKGYQIGTSVILLIVSLYFFIGFGMIAFAQCSKVFKKFYNNNILTINSLKHRFISFNGVLYVVTLLVIGGMLFISVAYCNYVSTIKINNINYKNDLSFIVESQDINKYNFLKIIQNSGADIKKYYQLENLLLSPIEVRKDNLKWLGGYFSVVSLSNYNLVTNQNKSLKENEILYLYNENKLPFSNYGLLVDYSSKDEEKQHFQILRTNISLNDWKKKSNSNSYFYVKSKDIIKVNETIDNLLISSNYMRKDFVVIDDKLYNKIKQSMDPKRIQYDILANLNNANDYSNYKGKLVSVLNEIGGKKMEGSIVIKDEKLFYDINKNSFGLFVYSFLGLMLLVGSCVVLYFKTFTSIDDDRKQVKQLFNFGLNQKEISRDIIKQLCIIFLIPPILALSIVALYITKLFKFVFAQLDLTSSLSTVFGVYLLLQLIFFLITTNRYLKKLKLIYL